MYIGWQQSQSKFQNDTATVHSYRLNVFKTRSGYSYSIYSPAGIKMYTSPYKQAMLKEEAKKEAEAHIRRIVQGE